MRRCSVALVLAACVASADAAGPFDNAEFGAELRAQWQGQQASEQGPLAAAAALQPGGFALPRGVATLAAELRGRVGPLAGIVTLEQQKPEGGPAQSEARLNELHLSGGIGAWQFSAGKKILGWDVGHGFRPNDLVQQEQRRALLPTTLEGRPLLLAEHFDADTAWSFVVVNPTEAAQTRGADEPALVARVYRHDGALDAYGYARHGAHTGASLGASFAWVASDALELHGSLRGLERADTLVLTADGETLVRSAPWLATTTGPALQALVGASWTNADQLSLLAEAWWDGTARSDDQWDAWTARNRGLAALPAPPAAVAGNLAWQASAFDGGHNLRRANLFGRIAWTHGAWQPALDLLLTPADRGRALTASLTWQGDRVRVDAGARFYGGPGAAVLAQLPVRRIGYLSATLAF